MEVTRSASAVDIAEYQRIKGVLERYEQAKVAVKTQIVQHGDYVVDRGHFLGLRVADLLIPSDSKTRFAYQTLVGRYISCQEAPKFYGPFDLVKQLDHISYDVENVFPWEADYLGASLRGAYENYRYLQKRLENILERIRAREMTHQMAELSLDPSLTEEPHGSN